MKSTLAAVLFASLTVGAHAGALSLTILSMNDHHSQLEAKDFDLTVSDSTTKATTGEKVNVDVGGFPMTVAAMNAVETAEVSASRSVMKLHAGDAITGGSYYSLFKGVADAKMMAHACFHAMAIGNHEFDDGDASLANFIGNMTNATLCSAGTQVLSSNVVAGPSSPLQNKYSKSYTFTLGSESVGVVGVTIKKKTEQSSFPDAGTTVSEEKAAAQAEIDALVSSGVDKIILLTHVNYNLDKTWMATLNNVDVVVGGDAHALLGEVTELTGMSARTEGSFPTELTNGSGKKVCVVQSWWGARTFGKLQVEFDSNGDVTSCTGKPQFAYDSTTFKNATDDKAFTATQKTAMVTYLNTLDNWHATTPDPTTAASLKVYKDQVSILKATKLADVSENICFERIPGQGRSTLCNISASYEHGGAACQLVAKGFLHRTKTADIAIQNGGGCRVDIAKGDFTINDGYTMLPFSNTIVTLNMTGAEIKAVLEDALSASHDGADPSTGAYPYVAGLRMDIDMSKAKGSRVLNVEINSRLAGSWSNIDTSATYEVATNNYIAAGKDGYVTFATSSVAGTYADTYMEYAQTMIDYAREMKTLVAPPVAEMSTKSYINLNGTSHTPSPPPPSSASRLTHTFTFAALLAGFLVLH